VLFALDCEHIARQTETERLDIMTTATTPAKSSTLKITFKADDCTLLHSLYRDAATNRVATVRILAGYVAANVSQKVVAETYVTEVGDYSTASVLQWLQGYAFASKAGLADNDESVTTAIKSITSTTAEQRNRVQPNMTAESFGEFVATIRAESKASKKAASKSPAPRPSTAAGKSQNPEKDAPTITPESKLAAPVMPFAELLAYLDGQLKGMSGTAGYEAAVIAASKVINRHKVAAAAAKPAKPVKVAA